jgi:hypothetical protein
VVLPYLYGWFDSRGKVAGTSPLGVNS